MTTIDIRTRFVHGKVFAATGGPRDARSSVRIAADAGLSDHAASGALRALATRGLVQRTKVSADPKAASYWTLTELGEYVQAITGSSR